MRLVGWSYGSVKFMSLYNLSSFRVSRQAGFRGLAVLLVMAIPPGHPEGRLDRIAVHGWGQAPVPGYRDISSVMEETLWVNLVASAMQWAFCPNKYLEVGAAHSDFQRALFDRDMFKDMLKERLTLC